MSSSGTDSPAPSGLVNQFRTAGGVNWTALFRSIVGGAVTAFVGGLIAFWTGTWAAIIDAVEGFIDWLLTFIGLQTSLPATILEGVWAGAGQQVAQFGPLGFAAAGVTVGVTAYILQRGVSEFVG